MKTTSGIDWMSFTDRLATIDKGYVAPPFVKHIDAMLETPRFGYQRAVKFPQGLIIMYDGSTAQMGQHYIYSGGAINKLLGEGISPATVYGWHTEQAHRCTRLDLAIDVYDDERFLQDLADAVYLSQYKGTARSANIIHSPVDGGMTIYMGSRTSAKFVRIYNKAVQMGQEGHWTRIEVELKGDAARGVMRAINDGVNGDPSQIAQAVIKSVCDFRTRGWREVFTGEPLKLTSAKDEQPDTEAWLMTQVVSAIAKFDRQYPEKRILDKIIAGVKGMRPDA